MEPTDKTKELVGQACIAWSYLEMLSESTLWGIFNLNEQTARAFIWRMQLSSKWQLIKREAKLSMSEADAATLKALAKDVEATARDRNIIVHGLVNAKMLITSPRPAPGTAVGSVSSPPTFDRQPCWTIFMGDDAGKNFLISPQAAQIVVDNIGKLNDRVQKFNAEHNFQSTWEPTDIIEEGWPRQL